MWDSRKITDQDHARYTERYIDREYADNDKVRSSAKSNINRALASTEMSFKTFMRGIAILPVKKIIFTLQVEWADGVNTYHQATAIQPTLYTEAEEIGGMKFTPKHRDELDDEDYDPE